MDGGAKLGKLKRCVVTIVNDDGKDLWTVENWTPINVYLCLRIVKYCKMLILQNSLGS